MNLDLALLSHRLVMTFVLVLALAGVVAVANGNETMVGAGGIAFVVLLSGVWLLGLSRARTRRRSDRLARNPAALAATTHEFIHHVTDTFEGENLQRIGEATQAIVVSTLDHLQKGTYKNDRHAARQLHLMSDQEFTETHDPRKIAITLAHLYYLGQAAGGETADNVTALVDNLIAGIRDSNL